MASQLTEPLADGRAMTIERIAELASVSRSTVSRVLNNHPNVRAAVRERVWEIVQQQSFTPNAAARTLVTKRTNIVGLLLLQSAQETFNDPFFSLLVPAIVEACARRGRPVMLSMVTADQELTYYRSVLRGGHMDGLLVGTNVVDDPILPMLLQDGMPLVLQGRHPYYPQAHWVDVDNLQASAQAVEHLITHGRRRIATLMLPLTLISGTDRRDGYKRALLQRRMQIEPELMVETDASAASGRRGMEQLLQLPHPPDAVFAHSDSLALGALSAIRAAGLRVPEDIAVVGFDDQPSAASAEPSLTTVRQPIAELGALGVDLLLSIIDGRIAEPQHLTLPTEFIVRASA